MTSQTWGRLAFSLLTLLFYYALGLNEALSLHVANASSLDNSNEQGRRQLRPGKRDRDQEQEREKRREWKREKERSEGGNGTPKAKPLAPGEKGGTVATRFLFPRLYILGTQKGGSSSLYELMIAHPLFCGGDHKEPMFFKEDEFFSNGREWYLSNYRDKKCKGKEGTFFVDGSTMMHRMPGVMERMDQFYSTEQKDDLRFIVLLREPVSRDFSWYQHWTRWYLEDHGPFTGVKTLQEHANTNKGNHFTNLYTHGEYSQQIKSFLGMFRRDQILIINSQMCFTDSPAVMRIIAKFLNVPYDPVWDQQFPHDDHLGNIDNADCVTKYVPKLDCSIRDELALWYEPKNKDFEQLLISTKDKAPPMEPNFEPFRDSYKKAKCSPDARKDLDQVIANSTIKSC